MPRESGPGSQGGGYGYSGSYSGGGITPSYYYGRGTEQAQSQQPSPYLQYTRDIQNLYRRQKQLQGADSRMNLPRINNQREVVAQSNSMNQKLPPIAASGGSGLGNQRQ